MQHSSFAGSIFNKENFSNLLGFKKKPSSNNITASTTNATAAQQNENAVPAGGVLTNRQPLSNVPQHIKFNHSNNIAANQSTTASSFAISAKATTSVQSATNAAAAAFQQAQQQHASKYSSFSSYTSSSSSTTGTQQSTARSSQAQQHPRYSIGASTDLSGIVEDNDFYDRRPSVTYTMEYQEDISNYMISTESKYLPNPNYITEVQKEMTPAMRSVLIDWIIDVHHKFKLQPETLFLAVLYLDRYLSKVVVAKNSLQLVGVAALLVACKYEEIYAPHLKDFVSICADAFTQEEIVDMEVNILNTLGFNLTHCSVNTFLQKFLLVNGSTCSGNGTVHGGVNSIVSSRLYYLSYYFAELVIMDYRSMQYTPSQVALACVFFAQQMMVQSGAKTSCVKVKAQASSVQGPLQLLMKAVEKDLKEREPGSKSRLDAVKKKYSLKKKFEVARFCGAFFAKTTV